MRCFWITYEKLSYPSLSSSSFVFYWNADKTQDIKTNGMEHLWWNDVKEVSSQSVFLCKHVVLICLKGDSEHIDNERARRQVEWDAVLPQEWLQLGCLLLQKLQCHFCPFRRQIKEKNKHWIGFTLDLPPAHLKQQLRFSPLILWMTRSTLP